MLVKIVGKQLANMPQCMHCPYCSAELLDAAAGELQCSSTGALFSRSVRLQFKVSRLEATLSPCNGTSFNPGKWFCPCCGKETDDGVCFNCGFAFTSGLIRQLIELNPHVRIQITE
jgi:hypothetical protein